MEVLLLIGCGVLLLMVLKRVTAGHDQAQRTLVGISDRLDELSRRMRMPTPGAGPAAEAAAMPTGGAPPQSMGDHSAPAQKPAETKTENVRVWDYSSPTPKPYEPEHVAVSPRMAEPSAAP